MFITIFEDDQDTAEILATYVRSLGHRAVTRDSCKAAKSILKSFKPHVVIIDLYLKDGCCLEILDQIYQDYGEEILVIVMSARNNALYVVSNHKYNTFLAKPFNLGLIENLLIRKLVIDTVKKPDIVAESKHLTLIRKGRYYYDDEYRE